VGSYQLWCVEWVCLRSPVRGGRDPQLGRRTKKKKEGEPSFEPRELLEGIQVRYVTTKSSRFLAK
jgi:hypothetical protein